MLHSGTLSTAAPPSAAAVMARSLGCIYPLARRARRRPSSTEHTFLMSRKTPSFCSWSFKASRLKGELKNAF